MPPNPSDSPYQATTVPKNKLNDKGYDETIYFFRHMNQK